MYVVAEEEPNGESENGNVIVLSSTWLTPRKVECFWPNAKLTKQFNKILQKHHEPEDDWSIIKIKRKFFETDDLILARRKAKEAEITSDLTDGEVRQKRKIRKTITSSSDDEENPVYYQKSRIKKKKIHLNSSSDEDPLQHHKSNKEKIFENQEYDNSYSTGTPLPTLTNLSPQKETVQIPTKSILVSGAAGITSGFEYNTSKILNTLLEQNNQILTWIRSQNEKEILTTKRTPIQIPINFPLEEEAAVQEIEKFLEDDKNFGELCEYFSAFASHTVTGTVNSILRHTVTNSLATKYNYRGKRGKKPFEALNLKTAIIRAVKKIFKLGADKQIEDDIKNWVKHAPQRKKLEEKKILGRLNRTV